MNKLHYAAFAALLLSCATSAGLFPSSTLPRAETKLPLGAFSASLTVKDLAASQAFYEKLGFTQTGGAKEQKWVVLRSGTTTIGLFQGMFDKNIMTFNPGWNSDAKPLESFTDVRELQRSFEAAGLKLTLRADEASTGPAYFTLADPDGNQLLFDQHVSKPK